MRADLKRLKRDTDSGRSAATAPSTTQELRESARAEIPAGTSTFSQKRWILAVALLAVVLIAATLAYVLTRRLPAPKVSNYVQLTHEGHPKQLVGTDGSRLYFGVGSGTLWGIAQVSLTGGEPVRIETPSGTMVPLSVSPDSTAAVPVPKPFMPHPNFSDEVNRNIVQSEIEGGVYLDDLLEGAVLEVETQNRWYTIVMRARGQELISGHPQYCPRPVPVRVEGCTWGGSITPIRELSAQNVNECVS
jgi:hypothetical protein